GFVAVGGAVARRLAAGAHRVHVAAACGGRRVPAPGCAWRGGGVAGGGGAVGGPGCEAAQVGRAVCAALASLGAGAAGRGGGGWVARPQPAPLQRSGTAAAWVGGRAGRLSSPTGGGVGKPAPG